VGGKVGRADRAAQFGQIGRDIGGQCPVIEIDNPGLGQTAQGAGQRGLAQHVAFAQGRPSGSNTLA
jgi:hypothetical protein